MIIETSLFINVNLLKENLTTVSELNGIDPSPAWYCCYLVISPDTNTVFPLLSLCGGVRGGPLNPSLFAFPSKGLCEECREFN